MSFLFMIGSEVIEHIQKHDEHHDGALLRLLHANTMLIYIETGKSEDRIHDDLRVLQDEFSLHVLRAVVRFVLPVQTCWVRGFRNGTGA